MNTSSSRFSRDHGNFDEISLDTEPLTLRMFADLVSYFRKVFAMVASWGPSHASPEENMAFCFPVGWAHARDGVDKSDGG